MEQRQQHQQQSTQQQQQRQQSSHPIEWQSTQQQQKQQEEEEQVVAEGEVNDDDQRLSWNQQITAVEHCAVAIETLLLQDHLPAMVSSLTHFQEWLLKPQEEVYQDPYEHLCPDDDDDTFADEETSFSI